MSVRLAAQCTDARVNVVVEGLYEKYPDVNALAAAEVMISKRLSARAGLGAARQGISAPV